MNCNFICKAILWFLYPTLVVSFHDKSDPNQRILESSKSLVKKLLQKQIRCIPFIPTPVPTAAPTFAPSSRPSFNSPKKILPPDSEVGDLFGSAVGIIDENVMVLSNSTINGSIYLFSSRSGGFEEKISPVPLFLEDYLGHNVGISSNTIVVGSPKHNDTKGCVNLIQLGNTSMITKLEAEDGNNGDEFGYSVAVSDSFIAVGAPIALNGALSGAVYLFNIEGEFIAKLTHPDASLLGLQIALGEEVVVAGAFGSIFTFSIESQELLTKFDIDESVKNIAVHGETISAGVLDGLFIYDVNGTLVTNLLTPDGSPGDEFGHSVAMSEDTIYVGAPGDITNTGAVYLFTKEGELVEKLVAPDGQEEEGFGWDVSIFESKLVVGASGSETSTGSAYIFSI